MFKKHAKSIILTSIITIIPIFIGLLLWNKLPDSIATHFNTAGQADGWSSKTFAVLGLPLFLLATHLLCLGVTLADPKQQNVSEKIFGLIMWIIPVVSLFANTLTYAYALGKDINVETFTTVFVGLVFIIIGNYLPKCKQNYTVGIKLPWTLNDTENWNHTHRFAGKLWIIGGIIFIAAGLIDLPVLGLIAFIPLVIAPMVYSYLYYKEHKNSDG